MNQYVDGGHELPSLPIEKHYLVVPPYDQEQSTIDFIELFKTLVQHWRTIILITAASTLLATVVAFSMPSSYLVKTYLSKPNTSQVQELVLNMAMGNVTNTWFFKKFTKMLSQDANIIDFLSQIKTGSANPSEKELQKINKMAKNFRVIVTRHDSHDTKDVFKDNTLESVVETSLPTVDVKARLNLNYIEFTNNKVLQEIITAQKARIQGKIRTIKQDIQQNITEIRKKRLNEIKVLSNQQRVQIDSINNKIAALKESERRKRAIYLTELENALQIAKKMGINSYKNASPIQTNNLLIELSNNNHQLFLYGTTYLKKELELIKKQSVSLTYLKKLSELQEELYLAKNNAQLIELQQRKNDGAYSRKNVKLLAKLKTLTSLKLDTPKVNLYSISSQPYVETFSRKPNRPLIVMIGFFVGLFGATALVLLKKSLAKIALSRSAESIQQIYSNQ